MATYRVERMTNTDYNIYMGGGYNYEVETLLIIAETVEDAIQAAQKPGMVVNKGYVKTLEEIKAEEEAKAKRKETEFRKATEMGLTVEEYRKAKARKATIAKVTREIEELERALEQKRKYLAELTERA